MEELLKRLELIKACIGLGDIDLIKMQLPILQRFDGNTETHNIIELLSADEYLEAKQAIDVYLQSQFGLVRFDDAEIAALRLELKSLENKLQDLVVQRDEALNTIDDFNREYILSLGSIINEILRLKKEMAKLVSDSKSEAYRSLLKEIKEHKKKTSDLKKQIIDLEEALETVEIFSDEYEELQSQIEELTDELTTEDKALKSVYQQAKKEKEYLDKDKTSQEYKEAEEDFESFNAEHEEVKAESVEELSANEKKELKKLYRKLSKLCHPDLVNQEFKKRATELMVEVNKAYKGKSITRLKKLLLIIENGNELSCASDTSVTKEELKLNVSALKRLYTEVTLELSVLQASETFILINNQDDWMSYFNELKKQLQQTLEELLVEYELMLNKDSTPPEKQTELNGSVITPH